MEKVIDIKDLVKDYKKMRAVDNLSFDVKKGEILGLLGPNRKWENYNNELHFITIKIQ